MTHSPSRISGEPEEAHGHSEPHPEHHVPYQKIFYLLVILTGVTVAVYYLLMAIGVRNEIVRVLIALAVAFVKATLVARFFMHLKFEGRLIYVIFLIPLVLTVLLIVALIPDVVFSPMFNAAPHHGLESDGSAPAAAEH